MDIEQLIVMRHRLVGETVSKLMRRLEIEDSFTNRVIMISLLWDLVNEVNKYDLEYLKD